MWTVLALAPLEGNDTLAGFLVMAAAFRFMSTGTFEDFPAILAEFKISQDVLGFPACKVALCQIPVQYSRQSLSHHRLPPMLKLPYALALLLLSLNSLIF